MLGDCSLDPRKDMVLLMGHWEVGIQLKLSCILALVAHVVGWLGKQNKVLVCHNSCCAMEAVEEGEEHA